MPVPTPSWAVRNGLHAEDLDANGHDAAEHVTYDNGSSGLTATDVQAAIDEIAGGTAAALTVQDEGTPLTTAADTLNFVGAGVTASGSGSTKTITISGSTVAALDDLTDAVITTPANADRLRYNGSTWENSDLVWEPMIASDGTVMTDGLLNPMLSEVAY